MAQLVWNLPFVCCFNKSPSGTSCKNDRCIQPSKTPMETAESLGDWRPLSAVTRGVSGLRNRGQHQKGSPVLLPGIFRSPFNTPFGEIMWTGLTTRKKRPSLWATSQQREFRLFQSCNIKILWPSSHLYINWGEHCGYWWNDGMGLFSAPPPPVVAFRRSERPSGQILWHLVACPSNRAFRSRKELAVGCGPQRAWGSPPHTRTNKHLNMKTVEPCKAEKMQENSLLKLDAPHLQFGFAAFLFAKQNRKDLPPTFEILSRSLTSFRPTWHHEEPQGHS